jgi:hypothetical protein
MAIDKDLLIRAIRTREEQAAVNASNGPEQPEPETEESLVSRIFQRPYQTAIDRMVGTIERVTGQDVKNKEAQLGRPLTNEERLATGTTAGSVLLQTASAPVSLLFDAVGEGIFFGAEQAVGLLSEDNQAALKQGLQSLASSEVGKAGIEAVIEGAEAYENWAKQNPNMAADFRAMFDMFGGGIIEKAGKKSFEALLHNPPVKPSARPVSFLERVGMRNVTRPLAGTDAYLYDLAFNTEKQALFPTVSRTAEQLDNMTNPNMFGTVSQLATPDQLSIIDSLKKAGISGADNYIVARQKFNAYMNKLDNQVITAARNLEVDFNGSDIAQRLTQNLANAGQEMPRLLKNKAIKTEVNDLFNQFLVYFNESGGGVDGMIQARRRLDAYAERRGASLNGDRMSALDSAAHLVRSTTNDMIAEVLPDYSDIMRERSSLINVQQNLINKGKTTAATALGRYLQFIDADKLIGGAALSVALNFGVTAGVGLAVSPFYVLRNIMRTRPVGDAKATAVYAARDLMKELDNAMRSAPAAVRENWTKVDRPLLYSVLRETAESIDSETEENQGQ